MTTGPRRTFDVRIVKKENGYTAFVGSPDRPPVEIPFEPPFNEDRLRYLVSETQRGLQPIRRGIDTRPLAGAKELGSGLFRSVFNGQILGRLDAALDQGGKDEILSVRVDVSDAPDLASLPWEYMYYPERSLWLASARGMGGVVRYASQVPGKVDTTKVEPPLRILAMVCSPRTLPDLDLEAEQRRLLKSLAKLIYSGLVEITWLEVNTLAALDAALNKKDYHIFHFVGHGQYLEHLNSGVLYFEDESGDAVKVRGDTLGWTLRGTVKLAFINACNTALSDTHDPSSGVASSLLLQGIPAVVAMQFEIADEMAADFASNFYGALSNGQSVDMAMSRARQRLMAQYPDSAEWATPVLYLRSPDGTLFDIPPLPQIQGATAVIEAEVLARWEAERQAKQGAGPRQAPPPPPPRPVTAPPPQPAAPAAPVAPVETAEMLYAQAVAAMDAERWEEASLLFERVHDKQPNYRDLARRWQECNRQIKLGALYKRLIGAYAREDWPQAVQLCDQLGGQATPYRDTDGYCTQARQALAKSRPPSLPGRNPPRPAGLPGRTGGDVRPAPPKKPPTVPR